MIDLGDRRDGRFAAAAGDALLDGHARRQPAIKSTSGFSSCSTNCRAYGDIESRNRRCPSAKSRSKASVDFPEPLRPVMMTIWSRGISSERFLRLCSRAPRTAIAVGWASARASAERLFGHAQAKSRRLRHPRTTFAIRGERGDVQHAETRAAPQNCAQKPPRVRRLAPRPPPACPPPPAPAATARLGTEIDDVVGALDDFEIVLDHEHAVPLLHQPVEDAHELRHVVEVQPGRRLVEDEERVRTFSF